MRIIIKLQLVWVWKFNMEERSKTSYILLEFWGVLLIGYYDKNQTKDWLEIGDLD